MTTGVLTPRLTWICWWLSWVSSPAAACGPWPRCTWPPSPCAPARSLSWSALPPWPSNDSRGQPGQAQTLYYIFLNVLWVNHHAKIKLTLMQTRDTSSYFSVLEKSSQIQLNSQIGCGNDQGRKQGKTKIREKYEAFSDAVHFLQLGPPDFK